ncbi:EcsC family protein [Rhodocytophaga rosea]|uniref:EcsC family protein n=1 Tax=Rhodocytophaga rosea TaxID=2704465 RepID=A0A6C0GM88_9BACT|nr:EcsC family protein [Rhodocytophaga rosea]QHT69156.1 EcsC family protein [Rhodocytophaga rosea]
MEHYEDQVKYELSVWQLSMEKGESASGRLAKGIQDKINTIIPEKVHQVVTEGIKHMVRAVLAGSEYTATDPMNIGSLEEREKLIKDKIEAYKKLAAVEGAGTGAGGFLLSLADFPLLLGLKIKLLYEIAGLYGYKVKDYQERVFILYVFQLAFSSTNTRKETYQKILNWDTTTQTHLAGMSVFDWRSFQQEYRDYIDLAKLLQLVPGIGAVVGAFANHRLVDKLGETAMNAYRLRWYNTAQKYIYR